MLYNLRYMPFVVIGVITLVVFIRHVIKNKFSEKESIIWAIAAFIMILSPLYMDYVDRLAHLVGVDYPPALIFALLFILVFFLIYRQSAATHKLNERIIELIQLNAVYEKELRDLREKVNTETKGKGKNDIAEQAVFEESIDA
ncbi:MAG: DUF2304 domain-containing protein [Oscillospiraceae bacterium]|nr:DUF2304 domain-containing protein [Oscillospiraceae bacterium]